MIIIFIVILWFIPGIAGNSKSRIDGDEEDIESCCSTCSSSSSSDEAAAYALPPRRAYGGVRISYVPNDAVACARKRTPTSSTSNQTQRDTDKCIVSWWYPRECRIVFISMYCLEENFLFRDYVTWGIGLCKSRIDEQSETWTNTNKNKSS